MRDYDDLPYIVIEQRREAGFSPFLWGALLGAGAALLLAPRTGEETQEEIRQRVLRLRTAAEGRVNETRGAVTDAVSRTRDRIQDRIDTVREVIETRTDQARHAYDTGRRAATDARSELERRVADARNAVTAVADVVHGTPARKPDIQVTEVDVVITDVTVEDAPGQPGLG